MEEFNDTSEYVDTREDVPETRESVRMAEAFLDVFLERFADAELIPGPENQTFAITVREFDGFLVDHGWLQDHPTNHPTGSIERNGLVQARNNKRSLLNYAAIRGLHGWPAFEVQDDKKGNYRVRLQTNMAATKHKQIAKALRTTLNGKLVDVRKFYKIVQTSQRLPADLRMRAVAHEHMLEMVIQNAAMQVTNYLEHSARFQAVVDAAEKLEMQKLPSPE